MATLYQSGIFQLLVFLLVAGCCVLLTWDGIRHLREKKAVERFDRLLRQMESQPRRGKRVVYRSRPTTPRNN